MSRKVVILLFTFAGIVFLSACGSSSSGKAEVSGTADLSGVWGVFISQESLVSDNALARADAVSTCNTNWSSSDPDTIIELWQLKQSNSSFVAADATSGVHIADGGWVGGQLLFEGATGTWRAQATVRGGACCFDATGTDGRHWHAIKMGGGSAGCQTGMDIWEANLTSALESGSKIIATKAGKVEYAIWGDSGPYILVFHGGQGGYDQIRAFAPGIIGKGYRILSWSRPGYLRTPLPCISSPKQQADIAAALLDALGIKDRVAAIGGSAGGPPLFSFALRHPDRLWAIIAESAVSRTYIPHYDYPYVNELVYMFENPGGMWIFNSMFEYATEATLRIFLRTVSTLDEASFAAWVSHVLADPDRLEAAKSILISMSPSASRMAGTTNDIIFDSLLGNMPLAGITAPTLVVHGTNDGDVDPVNAEYSAATIPGAELKWVPGGSHLLVLADDADMVDQAELDFLWQHAP